MGVEAAKQVAISLGGHPALKKGAPTCNGEYNTSDTIKVGLF